ncbi:WD40 repeat domain-containing protein [Sphingobacterium hungaricum]|uniref:WD40 repeat domain-containing protein n=1 Tax=Sphingobacterium hungaricum TaxID=2082723 RepID=A0A928UXV0_9SPHI|nr:WD40 repeat domain-containing protein [Sphingobacterium hungaricum]MBE8713451.1 WD40 repeat domain-containing protein [Sphingobacterium hungaricum]
MDIVLKATLTGHQNPIFAIESSEDQQSIFTGGNDKGIVEWDVKTLKFKRILCAVDSSVYVIHRLPNSNILAVGLRSGELMFIDVNEQKLLAKFKTNQGALFAIQSFSSKPEVIAIGEEGYAYVLNSEDFQLKYRFKVSPTTVRSIAISDDEQQVAFGDKNGFVYIYDARDYESIYQNQLHELPVTSLLFDKEYLFSGGRDAKLHQLNRADFSIRKSIVPHMFTVYGIVKHPDFPFIATASRDKTFKIWDKDSLALLKNISRDKGYESHSLSINNILWNSYLYTVSDDKTVKVWEIGL